MNTIDPTETGAAARADTANADAPQTNAGSSPAPTQDEPIEEVLWRFVEENGWLAKPRLPLPPRPPEPKSIHQMTPEEMHESIPVHLRRQRPDGTYYAMGLISRMQQDLEDLTQGKRAATYPEVDEYLGYALLAEGLAPRGLSAPEAVKWWRAGGSDVLREPAEGLADESDVPDPVAHRDRIEWTESEVSPSGTTSRSPIQLAAAENGFADAAGAVEGIKGRPPTMTNQARPLSPTTESEMLKDIRSWPTRKTKGAPATGNNAATLPVRNAPARNETPRTPASSAGGSGRRSDFAKSWPVAGDGRTPLRGQRDNRGMSFSNGSFDLTGKTRSGRPHKGRDLPGKIGDPVAAAADGVVVAVTAERKMIPAIDPKTRKPLLKKVGGRYVPYKVPGPLKGYGYFVVIRHADGYETRYAHLKTLPPLKPGTAVRRGQEIGRLGVTGNAATKGSHVHFEVRAGKTAYDPADWIAGRLPPLRR